MLYFLNPSANIFYSPNPLIVRKTYSTILIPNIVIFPSHLIFKTYNEWRGFSKTMYNKEGRLAAQAFVSMQIFIF